jgi:hypothetical protein
MTDGLQQDGAAHEDRPRRRRRVALVATLLALIAVLVTVRVLDSHRDQRNQVLISLIQLGNLFGQADSATVSLPVAPSTARLGELAYANVQIAQRLPYLRHQGLSGSDVGALTAALRRYQSDARTTAPADRTPVLAADAAAINALINGYVRSYKASYARWDAALDTSTVVFLVAAIAGVLAVLVWPRRHPVPSGGTGANSPSPD